LGFGQVAEEEVAYDAKEGITSLANLPKDEIDRLIRGLEEEMRQAAEELDFEYAARVRDKISGLRQELGDLKDKRANKGRVRH
jgi:excinuclease UvrABC nuclease subunit